jgi:hypothetical protein
MFPVKFLERILFRADGGDAVPPAGIAFHLGVQRIWDKSNSKPARTREVSFPLISAEPWSS